MGLIENGLIFVYNIFTMLNNNLEQIKKDIQHLSKRVDAHDLRFDTLDEKIDLIARTLNGHDFEFISISERFEQVDKRFEQVDKRFEQMAGVLIDHNQRLANIEENMVTKKEFRELMNTLDYSVKEVMNMKEDHVFGVEWMKRMQDQLGWHEQDIRKLKLMLNLA